MDPRDGSPLAPSVCSDDSDDSDATVLVESKDSTTTNERRGRRWLVCLLPRTTAAYVEKNNVYYVPVFDQPHQYVLVREDMFLSLQSSLQHIAYPDEDSLDEDSLEEDSLEEDSLEEDSPDEDSSDEDSSDEDSSDEDGSEGFSLVEASLGDKRGLGDAVQSRIEQTPIGPRDLIGHGRNRSLLQTMLLLELQILFADIKGDTDLANNFFRHLLTYVVIVSESDDQLRCLLKLDTDNLMDTVFRSLCKRPFGEALEAVGLLRRLLLECGGPELKRQHRLLQCYRKSCYLLTDIFETSIAHEPCLIETAFEFIRQNAAGDLFAFFTQEEHQPTSEPPPVSRTNLFRIRCAELMERGVTCPSYLRLPDWIGFLITEPQGRIIWSFSKALQDKDIPSRSHNNLLALLKYASTASLDFTFKKYLYLASARLASYLRQELVKPIQGQRTRFSILLHGFCNRESLTAPHSVAKPKIDDLIYFNELLQGRNASPRRPLGSISIAFDKACKELELKVDNIPDKIVAYWVLRLRNCNPEAALRGVISQ